MTDHTITLTTQELSAPFRIPEPEAEPLKQPTRIMGVTDGSSFQYLRFVRHHEVEAFKEKGWVVSDDLVGTHHGAHAALMSWPHEGEPE